MTKVVTGDLVKKIAGLSNIPIDKKEESELTERFNSVLKVVDKLFKVDVKNVQPVHQVTGLENVFREDVVDEEKMLSQEDGLKNAKRKYNGYFVVDQVLAAD